MKTCAKCQRDLPPGAYFCAACGAPVVDPSSAEDPFIGKIVRGIYFVQQRIGGGGMGQVYRAMHVNLDVPVAIKFLNRSLLSDPSVVQRFQREARAASRLRHQNVIAVSDFGQLEDGTLFMVMEHVAGRSLGRIVVEDQPIAEARVVHLGAQILSALAEAHAAQILHRDLKPDNVMVESRREERDLVKVLDFGIAKLQQPGEGHLTLTQPGLVCGTPGYMSPEQWTGTELDARSDLYAVGVILYELLTGALPYDTTTPLEVVRKHLTEAPVSMAARRRGRPPVSQELEALVMRALSVPREGRSGSADAMRRELLACNVRPVTGQAPAGAMPTVVLTPVSLAGQPAPGPPASLTPAPPTQVPVPVQPPTPTPQPQLPAPPSSATPLPQVARPLPPSLVTPLASSKASAAALTGQPALRAEPMFQEDLQVSSTPLGMPQAPEPLPVLTAPAVSPAAEAMPGAPRPPERPAVPGPAGTVNLPAGLAPKGRGGAVVLMLVAAGVVLAGGYAFFGRKGDSPAKERQSPVAATPPNPLPAPSEPVKSAASPAPPAPASAPSTSVVEAAPAPAPASKPADKTPPAAPASPPAQLPSQAAAGSTVAAGPGSTLAREPKLPAAAARPVETKPTIRTVKEQPKTREVLLAGAPAGPSIGQAGGAESVQAPPPGRPPLEVKGVLNAIRTPSAITGEGVLVVQVEQYGDVTLDDRPYGEAPREFRLPGGTYRVQVTNGKLGTRKTTLTVRPGERRVWTVDFIQP